MAKLEFLPVVTGYKTCHCGINFIQKFSFINYIPRLIMSEWEFEKNGSTFLLSRECLNLSLAPINLKSVGDSRRQSARVYVGLPYFNGNTWFRSIRLCRLWIGRIGIAEMSSTFTTLPIKENFDGNTCRRRRRLNFCWKWSHGWAIKGERSKENHSIRYTVSFCFW